MTAGVEESCVVAAGSSLVSARVTVASEVNADGDAGEEYEEGREENDVENESGEEPMADTAAATSPLGSPSGTSTGGATAGGDEWKLVSNTFDATRFGPGNVRPITTIATTAKATGL
ncbi:MAG TPA: hypothetical protein VM143_07345 [Acidimicrobiales bacterium]|nr:hypothetical protein [Acidimicrobiales bacterium]